MTSIIELENEYTIENGIIKNPGKFEGETLATPYYYDIMVNGEGDLIQISDDDRIIFDIEPKYTHVVVIESDSGFVSLFWAESWEEATNEANKQFLINNENVDYLFE